MTKTILIIGSSYGIGKELAKQLDRPENNLFLCSRSLVKLQELQFSIKCQSNIFSCDITQEKELKKLHKDILKITTNIDLIIFCAGIYEPMNINNFNKKKADKIIDINLTGFLNFFSVFLKSFKDSNIGQLVVLSSIAGYFGMSNSLAYGASKAALSNLTESLFYELQEYGTKVQLVNPGFVKTRLTAKNKFKMPNIISSKTAAKIIIKNLKKNKFEIKFPFIFANFMKLLAILPYKLRLNFLKYVTK
ncbi:SDR family NAD(P)-dependent oxidoreductase [Rickettsiales bacterium]|nr:SDR family NAD(P)-dependent oxidoreductase [Rickettsiales bacterium]